MYRQPMEPESSNTNIRLGSTDSLRNSGTEDRLTWAKAAWVVANENARLAANADSRDKCDFLGLGLICKLMANSPFRAGRKYSCAARKISLSTGVVKAQLIAEH